MGKTIGTPQENGGFMGFDGGYPLVMSNSLLLNMAHLSWILPVKMVILLFLQRRKCIGKDIALGCVAQMLHAAGMSIPTLNKKIKIKKEKWLSFVGQYSSRFASGLGNKHLQRKNRLGTSLRTVRQSLHQVHPSLSEGPSTSWLWNEPANPNH